MNTLRQTIDDAIARLGPTVEDRLDEIAAELGELALGEEDQLSAVATALAAVAATHHRGHKPVYLEAVRVWALEISTQFRHAMDWTSPDFEGPVEEGAEILVNGLDSLLETLATGTSKLQDRLVMELALFAHLLGRHNAAAVHAALRAATDALGDGGYQPGDAVRVALDLPSLPLDRNACLAELAPRGVA
jgi:hypothetical protein